MKLLLPLFCLLGASLAIKVNNTQTRLIGSATVESLDRFPWMVSIQMNGFHKCGGAAISNRYILTTASCVSNLNQKFTKIRYNTLIVNFEGEIVDISNIIPHPEFDVEHYENNIALIYTAADMKINRFAKIPCSMNLMENALLEFSGWGSRKEDSNEATVDLQYVEMPYLGHKCKNYHLNLGINMDDSMFCVGDFEHGGIGICNGDDGGVALRPGTAFAYGVASFHYGCAKPRYTSIFIKISNYKSWIQQTTTIPCEAPTM